MPLVGMLHYRLDPRKVKKTYAFAAVAKVEGIDFFYFTPRKVNFDNKTILGKVLKNGEWVEKVFPFPDVVYNAGVSSSPTSEAIVDKLSEMIPFTSHSVGPKSKVYHKIRNAKQFTDHLIPYKTISKKKEIYEYLNKYQRIILKPISGSQGNGIYYIESSGNKYIVIQKATKQILAKIDFDQFIDSIISPDTFLVQQYINCKTKSGNAFDFRLHIQKNGQGQWVVTTIYCRIGPHDSIITNISNGGSATYLKPLLKQEFPENEEELARKLISFGLALGSHMDEIYGKSFDELGVDVGVDKNQKIWLYEVNWRPGAPATFYFELDVITNSLQYAAYLAKQK